MMTAERRRKSGKSKKKGCIRVGIRYADEHKIRGKLRGNRGTADHFIAEGEGVCLPPANPETYQPVTFWPSEPWIDSTFRQVDDLDADGTPISVRYHDSRVQLPPGMIRCPRCGHATPPNAMEGKRCADCRREWEHERHGPSPSAMAIRQIEYRCGRPDPVQKDAGMLPEGTSALRREIKRFRKGKWRAEP